MTVRVDVVVSGVDYLSDGRDHPMHHTHLGLYDEIQAMIRIYNGHHHLHADSPLTKVIRNIMGHIVGLKTQLTAQSSRITALETAVTALQAAHAEGSAETEDSEAE